jgi:hypothetical protein
MLYRLQAEFSNDTLSPIRLKAVQHSSRMQLNRLNRLTLVSLVVGTALIYFFSNPEPGAHFDYTFQIAGALLEGKLGLEEQPESWLNEMVPFEGSYYSVFPLGAVLTMLPVALLKAVGLLKSFPAAAIAALTAGSISLFLFLFTFRYDISWQRRCLLVLFVMFGTWMWCNLTFGGAWQIALGFAVLGQLGALYFILIKPKPLVAGFFFAVAFGNRTEILLVAPLLMYLIWSTQQHWSRLLRFCAFPFALGIATLFYNYVRFHSPFDFGYARIPGVLDEEWYQHGIFSIHSISLNLKMMLLETWKVIGHSPYLVPTGFGGSIFLSSPFLVMLFERGSRDSRLKMLAWIAIVVLTLVLWLHGNPGGWQFSYRYAMILLPWMFVILLENPRRGVSKLEVALVALSFGINAYGTYLFHWTDYVQP